MLAIGPPSLLFYG